jgi:hypothetical protein
MVMAVVVFTDEFKARGAVAEIKPLHHAHFLQQVHRAVDGRQVTPASGRFGKNFPVGERMRVTPQNFQNGRARAGDFARLPPQPAFQRGHFLPLAGMRVRVRFHSPHKITLEIPKSKLQVICNRQFAATPMTVALAMSRRRQIRETAACGSGLSGAVLGEEIVGLLP